MITLRKLIIFNKLKVRKQQNRQTFIIRNFVNKLLKFLIQCKFCVKVIHLLCILFNPIINSLNGIRSNIILFCINRLFLPFNINYSVLFLLIPFLYFKNVYFICRFYFLNDFLRIPFCFVY